MDFRVHRWATARIMRFEFWAVRAGSTAAAVLLRKSLLVLLSHTSKSTSKLMICSRIDNIAQRTTWLYLLCLHLYNKAQIILSCPGLPWPYLWTNFETKGTNGLPMTQGWLEKYKNFQNFFSFLFFFCQNFWIFFVPTKNFPPRMPHYPNQKFIS